ncbi:DNA double-strand break repair nuclease NurA [Candidatus Dependentiae bacterium]|nr:DNA double-strand break repair nuclease NurA [Candidatus Dependentiae bacterium]
MLDRFKLFQELERVSQNFFSVSKECIMQLEILFEQVKNDEHLVLMIASKKWSLLLPSWHGKLGQTFLIKEHQHPYQVLAVDGSQIYYDKHQGPACSLINIGVVYLQYGLHTSKVELSSYPEILVVDQDQQYVLDAEYINLYREQCELIEAVKSSEQSIQQLIDPFMCLLDGSLIFFQVDDEKNENSQNFFNKYIEELQLFFNSKILHVAYMSFPKTKDMINIIRLVSADFQEKNIKQSDYFSNLLDVDLLRIFLAEGHRTIIFESKAPICYAYPKHLKPYFCYLNVGLEIVRLEFAGWIAQDPMLVDRLCAIVLDQAIKGNGYPVALFEAHEQAVIKTVDREFFYATIKQIYLKNNQDYKISSKSSKKIQPPF